MTKGPRNLPDSAPRESWFILSGDPSRTPLPVETRDTMPITDASKSAPASAPSPLDAILRLLSGKRSD